MNSGIVTYIHAYSSMFSTISVPSGPNSRVFLRFSAPTFEDRLVRAFEGVRTVEQFLPFLNVGVSCVLFVTTSSGVILSVVSLLVDTECN